MSDSTIADKFTENVYLRQGLKLSPRLRELYTKLDYAASDHSTTKRLEEAIEALRNRIAADKMLLETLESDLRYHKYDVVKNNWYEALSDEDKALVDEFDAGLRTKLDIKRKDSETDTGHHFQQRSYNNE